VTNEPATEAGRPFHLPVTDGASFIPVHVIMPLVRLCVSISLLLNRLQNSEVPNLVVCFYLSRECYTYQWRALVIRHDTQCGPKQSGLNCLVEAIDILRLI
jgi:hypothetical protein